MKTTILTLVLAALLTNYVYAQPKVKTSIKRSPHYEKVKHSKYPNLLKQRWMGSGFSVMNCTRVQDSKSNISYGGQLSAVFFNRPKGAVEINFGFSFFTLTQKTSLSESKPYRINRSYVLYNLNAQKMFLFTTTRMRPYISLGGGVGMGVLKEGEIKSSSVMINLTGGTGLMYDVSRSIKLNLNTGVTDGLHGIAIWQGLDVEHMLNVCTSISLIIKIRDM